MKKLKVWKEVTRLEVDGYKLSEIRDQLDVMIATYGNQSKVDLQQYDYDDGYYLSVKVEREETDREYQLRTDNQKRKEEYERSQYERLKKKFG